LSVNAIANDVLNFSVCLAGLVTGDTAFTRTIS
jgi:hypothetical protein